MSKTPKSLLDWVEEQPRDERLLPLVEWRCRPGAPPPEAPEWLLAATKRIWAQMPEPRFIQYISAEEYAVYCMVDFLLWGAE